MLCTCFVSAIVLGSRDKTVRHNFLKEFIYLLVKKGRKGGRKQERERGKEDGGGMGMKEGRHCRKGRIFTEYLICSKQNLF